MLLLGCHTFFTQEPPLHLCIPSGAYPMCPITENGSTYIMKNGERTLTVATYLKADPTDHLFLGKTLGLVQQDGESPRRLVVVDKPRSIERFALWIREVENPEIVIRWLGEG